MKAGLVVELMGGLGNQLFQYHAGLVVAELTKQKLILDISRARHGRTDHGVEIVNFDLKAEVLLESSRSRRHLPRLPGLDRTKRFVSDRIWNPLLRHLPALAAQAGIYVAASPGFEESVLTLRSTRKLRGYFQSWRYAEVANQLGAPRRLELRNASSWLDAVLDEAMHLEPIALHVRLGDYADIPQFGVLDSDYYKRAIALLRSQGLAGPLWLFSDQADLAIESLSKVGIRIDKVVSGSAGPAADLLAMASSRAVVMANSTFSWWAAWMLGEHARVVAPQPWFRRFPEPRDLIPPGWQRISAGHQNHA